MTVLHRQGFESVQEVERCVLEPGGTFDIKRKMPPRQRWQHDEVMRSPEGAAGQDRLLWRRRVARRDVL